MRSFYVYVHTKPCGMPFYIGKGSLRRSRQFSYRSQRHNNIVAKYGHENIGIFAFKCESEQDAFDSEIAAIKQLRAEGYLLANLTDGGEGTSGYQMTDATKALISKRHLGKTMSEETRNKISKTKTGAPQKPRTAEHCAKLSLARKGQFQSPPTAASKAKISASLVVFHAKNKLLRNQAKSELKCASLDGLEHSGEQNAILRGEAEIA